MKASELRPGQFFEGINGRCLCVNHTATHAIYVAKGERWIREYHHSHDVTPLAVAGWDDEPTDDTWTKLQSLIADQAAWSQETFGSDKDRGPIGALKHLLKEAQECINNPSDKKERADVFLLLLDAHRRSGWSFGDLVDTSIAKMVETKKRQWPKPTSDEPVEHIEPAPSTPEPQLNEWQTCDDGCCPDDAVGKWVWFRKHRNDEVYHLFYDYIDWEDVEFYTTTQPTCENEATAAEIAAVELKPLQLAKGKYYELENREIVGPAEPYQHPNYPVFCWNVGGRIYTMTGEYNSCGPFQIIREVPPPVSEPATEQKREAEADGWIVHDGTDESAPSGVGDIKFRDGQIEEGMHFDEWQWSHGNHESDIVAYRVVPPEPPKPVRKCRTCGKPATCHGTYESVTGDSCDDCCGHGCEDGFCHPIEDTVNKMKAAETSPARNIRKQPSPPIIVDMDNREVQPKQYRPFASAAEFAVHRDRWIREKNTEDCKDFRTSIRCYHDGVVWLSSGTIPISWQELFDGWEFDNGEPCGVEVK